MFSREKQFFDIDKIHVYQYFELYNDMHVFRDISQTVSEISRFITYIYTVYIYIYIERERERERERELKSQMGF